MENLRDGLCRHDPAHAKQYEENAAAYIRQIEAIGGRLKAAAASLPFKTCVTFHDSLSYMAADWGLTVAASLSIGEESGVSAADLAQAEQQAKAAGQILLLYDSQYPVEYAYVGASARESRVLALRTGVSGDPVPSAWLDAMTYNLSLLEELSGAKGGDGA
ncbi:MAG: zinc ABC transporter substrate-binding protein [Oscillospiraceae bacterium]|nr:zinc ABC transporter substrate-binding protein [Oscillospiraceae bacterium]